MDKEHWKRLNKEHWLFKYLLPPKKAFIILQRGESTYLTYDHFIHALYDDYHKLALNLGSVYLSNGTIELLKDPSYDLKEWEDG